MPDTLWTFARLKISVAGTTLRTPRRRSGTAGTTAPRLPMTTLAFRAG